MVNKKVDPLIEQESNAGCSLEIKVIKTFLERYNTIKKILKKIKWKTWKSRSIDGL